MSRNRLAALIAVSAIAAACSTGISSTPSASPTSAISPSVSTGSSAPAAATRVEVKLTDALKIEPAEIKVPVGQPVTFVVTNAGGNDHEFYVGDEAAQMKHEGEMMSMGGMAHDEANGIGLKPGETKELTITFDAAGSTVGGCHTTGHYAAGMKATITIGS